MREFVFIEAEKTSKYTGVFWNKQRQKWVAAITVNNKKKSGGCYISELDAAHGVNAVCDDLGLDRKNPELGNPPSNWKVPSLSIIHVLRIIYLPPPTFYFKMVACVYFLSYPFGNSKHFTWGFAPRHQVNQ